MTENISEVLECWVLTPWNGVSIWYDRTSSFIEFAIILFNFRHNFREEVDWAQFTFGLRAMVVLMETTALTIISRQIFIPLPSHL